tara:strand:+ start:5175 stop:5648 length:474 start_codon:yes stop_codon:yes gene_type:complete
MNRDDWGYNDPFEAYIGPDNPFEFSDRDRVGLRKWDWKDWRLFIGGVLLIVLSPYLLTLGLVAWVVVCNVAGVLMALYGLYEYGLNKVKRKAESGTDTSSPKNVERRAKNALGNVIISNDELLSILEDFETQESRDTVRVIHRRFYSEDSPPINPRD